MSLLETVLGRPLASSEASKEKLSVPTGVPVLGFDALSSVAYGPEAALSVLAVVSVAGLRYLPVITLTILALLALLFLSYLQTIAAYPNGGGSYTVAKENLGTQAGLFAAAALMVDYTLNVAVGISAGVAALVSALPSLHPYTLGLCLIALLILTLVNLRGVRTSGTVFELPAILFVCCIGAAILLGLAHTIHSHGNPQAIVPPPALPSGTAQGVGLWLLLRAFANGCTAMTGVEAVSNGVPLFTEPRVFNARMTLTVIVILLGVLLIGTAYLCPIYHIGAMDQSKPGYQTVLSMLVGAAAGHGTFYYISMASILMILIFSANTSFADFPRVCRLLARDGFLPHSFAERGSRLVFTAGILVLATFSGVILIAFGGITELLIPLFAVGAFTAFTLSQAGMVVHWKRKGGNRSGLSSLVNGFGATATGITLIIIVTAKFVEGAWITLLIIPAMMLLFHRVRDHYVKIDREIGAPVKLAASDVPSLSVIIPIQGWNRLAEKALLVAMAMSDDITAVHIQTDDGEAGEAGETSTGEGDERGDKRTRKGARANLRSSAGGRNRMPPVKKNGQEKAENSRPPASSRESTNGDECSEPQCEEEQLRRLWAENVEAPARAAKRPVPCLEIIRSPYRQVRKPIVEFVKKHGGHSSDHIVAVLVPELVEPHWHQYLLHNQSIALLRAELIRQKRHIIVVHVPWRLNRR